MGEETWRKKWQDAYDGAGFYQSEKNTEAYWNKAAGLDGGGLAGTEHIRLITEYLFEQKLLDSRSTVLDLGCGGGDYTVSFAERCGHVTALDYAEEMLKRCRERCGQSGLDNVSFVRADMLRYSFREKYDCVMACLNPAAYQPDALDRMLSLAEKCVVLFSMDIPIEGGKAEPVYNGCNSVRYAEAYLKELGRTWTRLPYDYPYKTEDGKTVRIPFAYLVIGEGIK
jgi:SAM-dependent methyltransferase